MELVGQRIAPVRIARPPQHSGMLALSASFKQTANGGDSAASDEELSAGQRRVDNTWPLQWVTMATDH